MTQQKQTHSQSNSHSKTTHASEDNLIQNSQAEVEQLAEQLAGLDDILADYIVAPTQVITETDDRPELRMSSEEFIQHFRQEGGQ